MFDGKYWFLKANSLDGFDVQNHRLVFKDLAEEYGFASGSQYHVKIVGVKGKRGKKIDSIETSSTSIELNSSWFSQYESLDLFIRIRRTGSEKKSPYVAVRVNSQGVERIIHQD